MKRTISTTALLSAATFASIAASKGPNVVIIYTDEQNFRTIGAHRALLPEEAAEPWGKGNVVETPNLDYLANNGAICANFYAASPVSSPSRSTFMSGMYMGDTHVVANDVHMNDNIETFAQTLKDNGYVTGYAGKWHLDGSDKPGWAPKSKFGFEHNEFMFNRGHFKVVEIKDGVPSIVMSKDGKREAFPSIADEKSFTTDFLGDRAVEFIRENKDKPFCYMVSIPDPHDGNSVRKPYDTMYDEMNFEIPASANLDKMNIPDWLKKTGSKRPAGLTLPEDPKQMRAYYGMVKCVDDNVGKIVNALKEANILDNTIVIFTADHGDMLGEHDKDNKGVPFEAAAKVPFIMHYPKTIKAGTIVRHPMGTPDFAPTILAMTGTKSSVDYAGRNCAELIKTNKIAKDWNNVVFSNMGSWIMATDGRYKLIRSVKPDGYIKENAPALFDLVEDPLEMNNVYGQKGLESTTKSLQAHMDRYYTTHWAINNGREKRVVWAESNTSKR
ncbi:MAG: sulfatase-like hydrolase/transferase [Rikenellaceae bacterium]